MGVKRPVLLRRPTSTGHYYEPVLLPSVTSSARFFVSVEWGSVAGTKAWLPEEEVRGEHVTFIARFG